jgi:hypothetical protein
MRVADQFGHNWPNQLRPFAVVSQAGLAHYGDAPPCYIRKELGERSSDPEKRKGWSRVSRQIEHYRQEHGRFRSHGIQT